MLASGRALQVIVLGERQRPRGPQRASRRAAASWSRITVDGLSGGGRADAPYPAAPTAPEPVTAGPRPPCDRRPRLPRGSGTISHQNSRWRSPGRPHAGRRPCSAGSAPGATTTDGSCRASGSSALVGGGVLNGAVGADSRPSSQLPDVESKQGFDILDARLRRPGRRRHRLHRVQAPPGRRRPRGQGGHGAVLRRRSPTTTASPVVSPYSPEGAGQIADHRRPGRQDRLRPRRDARRPRASTEAADLGDADPRSSSPTVEGLRIELGGGVFAEFEPPSSELLGLGLRHRHPDPGLRLGAGHGPARSASPWSASASAACLVDPAQPRARRCPTSPRSSA